MKDVLPGGLLETPDPDEKSNANSKGVVPAAAPEVEPEPATIFLGVPGYPPVAPKVEELTLAVAPTKPDRWFLMEQLQGNWFGSVLDEHRTSISGWIEQSYTASTANVSNLPVTWNDRANQYLLNQAWFRLERSVVTSGTTDITWGYRLDVTSGTDYRFAMMRGLLNSQLQNSRVTADGSPVQNLYGVDPIQFYTNIYVPNLFQGTDIRVGRLFTPWGYESLEGVSTPFVSRSYAFNWSPPFTHMGIMMSPTFNAQWSGKFMLANGNDVFMNSPYQELRSVGSITWTSENKQDAATFGWTLGRGKFNSAGAYNPATASEQTEPAGRNNINVFDLVLSHNFNSRFNYSAEILYGYQYGVPTNVPGSPFGVPTNNPGPIIREGVTEGTAHWGSIAQYLNYTITPELVSITRFELFDDFDGQRTGFKGLYTEVTTGFQYKPTKYLTLRPEIRYDYNGYSLPFENHHGILTSAIDAIIRY